MKEAEGLSWSQLIKMLLGFDREMAQSVDEKVNVVVAVIAEFWRGEDLEGVGFAFAAAAGEDGDRVIFILG